MNAAHEIELQEEDTVVLKLPSGHLFTIQLSDIDDGAWPQLDMWFEDDVTLMANCYGEHLEPAKGDGHRLVVNQIIIPVPRNKDNEEEEREEDDYE